MDGLFLFCGVIGFVVFVIYAVIVWRHLDSGGQVYPGGSIVRFESEWRESHGVKKKGR